MSTFVTLDAPYFQAAGGLMLARVPHFLRFVTSDSFKKWDALDQLDDEPQDGETIVAAELHYRGMVHIDMVEKRKKVGKWFRTATYRPIDPQPSREILADVVKWREWCVANFKK